MPLSPPPPSFFFFTLAILSLLPPSSIITLRAFQRGAEVKQYGKLIGGGERGARGVWSWRPGIGGIQRVGYGIGGGECLRTDAWRTQHEEGTR